jgi:ABC-type multidrug transport system fused ATPase/permease subunit
VSALFSAGVGALKVMADPLTQLREIAFWLLGGLPAITWTPLLTIAPAVVVALAVIYRMRWRLNLLSLDDVTAHSLGVAPGRERALLLGAAVVATAAVVSVCGMVGWLGLIVPHLARRLFGADTRYVLPAAVLIGALVAVGCDDAAHPVGRGDPDRHPHLVHRRRVLPRRADPPGLHRPRHSRSGHSPPWCRLPRRVMTALLRFDDVTFAYRTGAPPVLDRLAFGVEPGTATVVLGPNGTGKSTLLPLASDWLRRWADSGRLKTVTDAAGRRAVEGVVLARMAEELAHALPKACPRPGMRIVGESSRNRFVGLVTRVTRDGVMAQVEIQAGPFRAVSLGRRRRHAGTPEIEHPPSRARARRKS